MSLISTLVKKIPGIQDAVLDREADGTQTLTLDLVGGGYIAIGDLADDDQHVDIHVHIGGGNDDVIAEYTVDTRVRAKVGDLLGGLD